jgi:Rab family protein
MSKDKHIQAVLKNLVDSNPDIEIAFLYSNQGLLIARYGQLEHVQRLKEDHETIYGAFTALVENLLKKISTEYKIGHYGTGSFETSDHRIIYVETGSEAILLLVCHYQTDLNKIFPVAYLVAEKIAQILEESFDFKFNTLEIPDLKMQTDFSLKLDRFLTKQENQVMEGVKQTHSIHPDKKIEKLFKLIVLGSAAVGKTTLVNSFLKKQQVADYRPTLGLSISNQKYSLRGSEEEIINFLIFDLAGQEFFKRVRHDYYRGAHCALIVYDITRKETFEEATNFWFEDARKELGNIPIVLIGNKIDLLKEREVTLEEGMNKANELRTFFIETSALHNLNVQDTFKIIGIGLFFRTMDVSSSTKES